MEQESDYYRWVREGRPGPHNDRSRYQLRLAVTLSNSHYKLLKFLSDMSGLSLDELARYILLEKLKQLEHEFPELVQNNP